MFFKLTFRRRLHPSKKLLAMYCRIKPGNDDGCVSANAPASPPSRR
jgi:hypothetical protein